MLISQSVQEWLNHTVADKTETSEYAVLITNMTSYQVHAQKTFRKQKGFSKLFTGLKINRHHIKTNKWNWIGNLMDIRRIQLF